jgi:DNA-binding CsgD family transcriptional regulator
MATSAVTVRRRIAQLCHDGIDGRDSRELRAAVLAELRQAVAFDAYAWLLTDPETKVGTAPLAEVPDLAALPRLIRLKYTTAVNRWTALTRGRCATLAAATGGDLSRSPLWRDLLAGYGVTDLASMVFADQFGCWGFLDLWRCGGPEPRFRPAEQALLGSLAPALTAALRGAQAATFAQPPAPVSALTAPVVLLLSGRLMLLDQTPRTDAHLRLMLPTSPGSAPVPAAAFNVAAQLLAVEAGVDDGPPTARAQLAGPEWISLRAARLAGPGQSGRPVQRDGSGRTEGADGAGQRSGAGQRDGAGQPGDAGQPRDAGQPDGGRIAVTVEPVALAGRIELYGRACGLTGRERELLHRLARGADTRLLAREMRLSPHTVQDHLKSVFAKTGCGSRGVLLARALGTGTGAGQTGPG